MTQPDKIGDTKMRDDEYCGTCGEGIAFGYKITCEKCCDESVQSIGLEEQDCPHERTTFSDPLSAGAYKAFEYECLDCGEVIVKTESDLMRECNED